jgi:hypothetical protein
MVRQIIIVVLLIASLGYAIFTYWPLFSPYLPGLPKARPALTAPAAPAGPTPTLIIPTQEAEDIELIVPTQEVRLVDPFALRIGVKTRVEEPLPTPTTLPPAGSKPAVKPVEPQLEGIWIDAEMKVAFISGQALPVGGKVLGWKVITIAKDHVVLQKGSGKRTLKLER